MARDSGGDEKKPTVMALAGPNSKYKLPGANPAGFWAGLWHGIVAPIAFFVSIFNQNIRIYETHNRGIIYDFGFILGLGGWSRGVR